MTTTAGPNDCGDPNDQDSLWLGLQQRVQDAQQQCQDIPQGFFVMGGGTSTTTNHLLVATDRITGIECPKLWDKTPTPHYWELAWEVANRYKKKLPMARIGMAVNAKGKRGYDQFHIHVGCIRQDVQDNLQKRDKDIKDIKTPPSYDWSILPIDKYNYRVLKIEQDPGLANQYLFRLVYDYLHYKEYKSDTQAEEKAKENMQHQTLVVAKRPKGAYTGEGFYILNSDTTSPSLKNPSGGTGHGENLLEKCPEK